MALIRFWSHCEIDYFKASYQTTEREIVRPFIGRRNAVVRHVNGGGND
jgi:hypothetical protein